MLAIPTFRFSSTYGLSGCLLAVILLSVGCGGSAPAPAPVATVDGAAGPVADPAAAPVTASTSVDAAGTKWLGKVPYDVFYDQPLGKVGAVPELGAAVSVAAAPAATSAEPMTTAVPATTSDTSAASEGGDAMAWSSLITGEVLDEESKVIRTRLTANLQSVSTYNRSIDAISTDGIIMAALAGVAERFDGEMRWKERAPEVRTLAYAVYENVGGKGRKAFDATALPFEQMLTLLNGGSVDVADVEEDMAFSDYAFRSALMERVDSSFNWLRSNIASETNLKSSQEDVVREASVLAMIGGMIKDESYEFYEEKAYQGYCDDFVSASVDAAQAARDGNFATFQDAMGRMNTSCGNCHGEYSLKDDSL